MPESTNLDGHLTAELVTVAERLDADQLRALVDEARRMREEQRRESPRRNWGGAA